MGDEMSKSQKRVNKAERPLLLTIILFPGIFYQWLLYTFVGGRHYSSSYFADTDKQERSHDVGALGDFLHRFLFFGDQKLALVKLVILQRAQIFRHVAELSQHSRIAEIAGRRITGATECDCTGMTQYLAQAFGTPNRDRRVWTLDGFTDNNAAVSNVERQRNEISNSGHSRVSPTPILLTFCSLFVLVSRV